MHTGTGKGSARSRAGAILMAVLGSIPLTAAQAAAPIVDASQMVRAEGPRWVTREGKPIVLKGANLGNWLINEFWMMGQGKHGIDDQCKLEAVLDRRFGYPNASASCSCSATAG